jgi:ribosomal protein S18 acetylase RimI-like enzyme
MFEKSYPVKLKLAGSFFAENQYMEIRLAKPTDHETVWEIFHRVIKTGDTYVYSPNTPKSSLNKIWFGEEMKTFVVEIEGLILGTYFLKPNQMDLGSHIANAGFMVHPEAFGKGIGKAMCGHCLETAKTLGYKGMQFNFVVSTNTIAIKLWKKFGFDIIGTIPDAFKHQRFGLVDAFIMYKKL